MLQAYCIVNNKWKMVTLYVCKSSSTNMDSHIFANCPFCLSLKNTWHFFHVYKKRSFGKLSYSFPLNSFEPLLLFLVIKPYKDSMCLWVNTISSIWVNIYSCFHSIVCLHLTWNSTLLLCIMKDLEMHYYLHILELWMYIGNIDL